MYRKSSSVKQYLDSSISHGTHRTVDLVESFIDALVDLRHPKAKQYQKEAGALLEKVYEEGEEEEDALEQLDYLLHEDLYDALDELAPNGYYFGAHPGDGSDFGFWKEGSKRISSFKKKAALKSIISELQSIAKSI